MSQYNSNKPHGTIRSIFKIPSNTNGPNRYRTRKEPTSGGELSFETTYINTPDTQALDSSRIITTRTEPSRSTQNGARHHFGSEHPTERMPLPQTPAFRWRQATRPDKPPRSIALSLAARPFCARNAIAPLKHAACDRFIPYEAEDSNSVAANVSNEDRACCYCYNSRSTRPNV